MSERRPHWDDDLIEAVRSGAYSALSPEEVFNVIAVVEDWRQSRTVLPTQWFDMVAQAYRAEAAIQRVRDATQDKAALESAFVTEHYDVFRDGWRAAMWTIENALGGPDE